MLLVEVVVCDPTPLRNWDVEELRGDAHSGHGPRSELEIKDISIKDGAPAMFRCETIQKVSWILRLTTARRRRCKNSAFVLSCIDGRLSSRRILKSGLFTMDEAGNGQSL